MKTSLFTFFLFVLFVGNAQSELNQYKYIIVPKKFDGFKNENQYLTSTLIKYLLAENGFNAVYEDALPDELSRDRCLGAFIGMNDNSGLFTTKLSLNLKDCQSNVVFETKEGTSRVKDYKTAYDQAIRDAFLSLERLDYAYSPETEEKASVKISFKNDVKQIEESGAQKPNNFVFAEDQATEKKTTDEIAARPSTLEEKVVSAPVGTGEFFNSVLYAQKLSNGYQVVDNTPKIVLKMIKSTMLDVFIAKSDKYDGLVYTREGRWFFEYTSGDQVIVEELKIKF